MYRRRAVVCVVAACLAAAVGVSCAKKPPAPPPPPQLSWQGDPCTKERLDKFIHQYGIKGCRLGIHPEEGILRGVLRDGFWRFRVGYVGKIDAAHRRAFKEGVAMWNRHSHVTGFMFEDATSKTDVDFRLIAGAPAGQPDAKAGDPIEKTSCSGFKPPGSHVWYSTMNSDWADDADAARLYAHELGHGLNLDHWLELSDSVMHEGDSGMDCRILAAHVIDEIQESDAINAFICGCGVRLKVPGQAPAQRP